MQVGNPTPARVIYGSSVCAAGIAAGGLGFQMRLLRLGQFKGVNIRNLMRMLTIVAFHRGPTGPLKRGTNRLG